MKATAQITVTVPSELLEAVERKRALSHESRAAVVRRLLGAALQDANQPDIERTFQGLVEQWQADTAILSSARQKAMHPAYQRIIGMGPVVLPLLLKELEARPAHWLWALQAITGENPADGYENFQQGVDAWLRWGRSRGLLE